VEKLEPTSAEFVKRSIKRAILMILAAIFLTITGPEQQSSAYSYDGYHWVTNSAKWPYSRVDVNYSSLPKEWRTAAYKARMEWNDKGNSNLYFYYSKTSRNTITKGSYGNTEWLAITRVKSIGRYIIEVDTVINEDELWNTKGVPLFWKHDLQSVLTHELGHWLSLDHSEYPYATMYGRNERGSIRSRTLSSDDIAGIQHIYGKK
jgi:predicted Zn-dependent protease